MRKIVISEAINGDMHHILAISIKEDMTYSVRHDDYALEWSEDVEPSAVTVTAIPVVCDGEPRPEYVDDDGDSSPWLGWRQPDGSFILAESVINGYRFNVELIESDGNIIFSPDSSDSSDSPDSSDEAWEIVNLTPHPIVLIDDIGIIETIPASGIVARASEESEAVSGYPFPVFRKKYGSVQGLPEPEPGVFYVVSALTAQACPERNDVLIVNDTVRDESGRIIGCRSFAHV